VRGTDAWENGTATATGALVVDTTAPTLTIASPAADSTPVFSPNGDGVGDVVGLSATTLRGRNAHDEGHDGGRGLRPDGHPPASPEPPTFSWDGRAGTGLVVADGDYRLSTSAGTPPGTPARRSSERPAS
jgi:hypothetical protein